MPARMSTRAITNLGVKSEVFSGEVIVGDFDTAAPGAGLSGSRRARSAGHGPYGARRGASVVVMRPPSHSSPGRRRLWRVATPVMVLLIGALFAVSAEQSDGFDLRGGRLTDLASVVRAE